MSQLTEEEQALIQKFIGLSAAESQSPPVNIQVLATSNIDWSKCILAMVITDYLVQDLPFTSAMLSAWGADPMTSFKPIAKNCYFIEFINEEDLDRALMGGLCSGSQANILSC